MVDIEHLRSEFVSRYGSVPRVFRAPGRINIIGEHTDYNDGFVLPAAIGFATFVAAAARDDRRVRAASLNLDGNSDLDLDDSGRQSERGWSKFVEGIALTLERSGFRLGGADLLIASDIPIGAGLSSSAALEISLAIALSTLAGHAVPRMELSRIGQAAEHDFAGVRSGIMDQFASVFGQTNHALFLDCRSLNWEPIDVSRAHFIICDTRTKHDLAEGEYNKRRAECEAAVAFFGRGSLRDLTLDEFETHSAGMHEIPKRRARHIINENARVLAAVEALKTADISTVGRLINESHESLRDDFEVSSKELDLIAGLARRDPNVLGSRMMGGGFGGCTINLMTPGAHDAFKDKLSADYHRETGIFPGIYDCRVAEGANEIG